MTFDSRVELFRLVPAKSYAPYRHEGYLITIRNSFGGLHASNINFTGMVQPCH